MARQPTSTIQLDQLRPVATPVDTFVQAGPSPLRAVADAFASGDQSLQKFLSIRDKKTEEDQRLKGRAAFYKEGSKEFADLVNSGEIPAHYSPFYVRGFKEAQGSAAGERIRANFGAAWDAWAGKNSDDPAAFDSFLQEFFKANIDTEDPDVLRGLLPSIEALQANATTQWNAYRHDQTVNGSLTAHGAVVSSTVSNGIDAGLVSDEGADYEAIFSNVNGIVAQQLSTGDPGGKAVNTFIDVMSAKIAETGDAKLLEWFDTTVPGKDYTYGDTPYGVEVKNRTVEALEVEARRQAAGLTAAEKAEQKRLKDEAQTAIIQGIIDDPNAPLDEAMLRQAELNGDPLARVHARQWRDTLMQQDPSNPREISEFYDTIIRGDMTPRVALMDGLNAGIFKTPEDIRAAVSFVQSYEGSQDAIERALGGSVARDVLGSIKVRTLAKDELMNPVTGWSDEGFEAATDFRHMVTDWVLQHPNATRYEINEQVAKFGKQITDRIQAPEDPISEGGTYERDPNLDFGNPYSEPQAQPDETGWYSPDPEIRQWEQSSGVSEQTATAMREQAGALGMDYEQYVRESLAGAGGTYVPDSRDLGEGEKRDVPLTPEAATKLLDQAFAMQRPNGGGEPYAPDTRQGIGNLLGLIRQEEAAGNYNAIYGNVGNKDDLSKYTLDQILGMQQQWRRQGKASTAIGGYQFIYRTLQGLKDELGLSGNERFTPKLQDTLALQLLRRRGIEGYLSGRTSKETFARSLSMEWASLPDPSTGRSFYDGDGLNKSRTDTASVYQALGLVRS